MRQIERYFSSPYTFQIPSNETVLLYSAFSGAVLSLAGLEAKSIANDLSGSAKEVAVDCLPDILMSQLIDGGFLVNDVNYQMTVIKERFREARVEYPIVLSLTTTMDCNLGCYYCYEERTSDRLESSDLTQILMYVEKRLLGRKSRKLHVDWYGGEPLLNLEFIEEASPALQKLCHSLSADYSASLISNGTCWPEDVGGFIVRHRIRQVQISFDGMRENHNRRRRYRNSIEQTQKSSFDEASTVVSALLDCCRVDLRLNLDSHNTEDLIPFIRHARSQGWFQRKFPAVFQPARLASYTEHSSFMRKSQLSISQFDDLREMVRAELKEARIEESEVPDGFPFPKMSVCCALSQDSVVVGADGRKYRCGLQVSEPANSVGTIRQHTGLFPILGDQKVNASLAIDKWWKDFDPTEAPRCSLCSFLPICWGGCPKKHFDGDTHSLVEQGEYWRLNLARLVGTGVGLELPFPVHFAEADQFRNL